MISMATMCYGFVISKSSIIVGLYQAQAEASSEEDHHDEEPVVSRTPIHANVVPAAKFQWFP